MNTHLRMFGKLRYNLIIFSLHPNESYSTFSGPDLYSMKVLKYNLEERRSPVKGLTHLGSP